MFILKLECDGNGKSLNYERPSHRCQATNDSVNRGNQ
jgi:hypothetical protein